MDAVDEAATAWLLASTALVLLMTPGLAIFYGGMVRTTGVLNMIMMSFISIPLMTVAWLWSATPSRSPRTGLADWLATSPTSGCSASTRTRPTGGSPNCCSPPSSWGSRSSPGAVVVYAFAVSYVLAKVIDRFTGFRVSAEDETTGVDFTQHAETAYAKGVHGHQPSRRPSPFGDLGAPGPRTEEAEEG